MAKVKVIGTDSGQDSTVYFNNITSETIFSFGSFNITSNFDNTTTLDYSNKVTRFVRPITLETMNISLSESESISVKDTQLKLNLDNSDLKSFIKYGSGYEFLRICVENIILNYPGSLFVNSSTNRTGNNTYYDFTYNSQTNISKFKVSTSYIENNFNLLFDDGNNSYEEGYEIKNINLSYDKYVVWNTFSGDTMYNVLGFTGFSNSRAYIMLSVEGNPFNTTAITNSINFHIRPNNTYFEKFRYTLNDYERFIISDRKNNDGFSFVIKEPKLLDDGSIIYSNVNLVWRTPDKYNIDISSTQYSIFLESLLSIGSKYDQIKTDLISRFLSPQSLKIYDTTESGKINKLLRVYGREFDIVKQFIDSLVYVNKITYDKKNNVPDQLVSNLAKVFGWNYFSLLNENELVESFFNIDEYERNLNTDLMPYEIDIELWRRILINTNYYWKSKGTREAIRSIFLLIGIPEEFINITEYVYTVDGKINPNTVNLTVNDFPSQSLPYDNSGYPIAPLETPTFYFQVSGDTDSGQEYLNVFRKAGFKLNRTVDNKKSWDYAGFTGRVHETTPQYYQLDSRLVLNTKEVDVGLDTSQGIEYDVFYYIKNVDIIANPNRSSGYVYPYSFVNISLDYTGTKNTFQLPIEYDNYQGDLEVRYNGILLNAPKESNYDGNSGGIYTEETYADYIVSGNSIVLKNSNYAINSNGRRDVIQATFIYSGSTNPISGVTVEYINTRVYPSILGTNIPLPSIPNGDIQLTINGINLTKGTAQFNADYSYDQINNQIVITNNQVISYLVSNPFVQLTYVKVNNSDDINARNEIYRVDSFTGSKFYFSQTANKNVYVLNFRIRNASELKLLVNGIALEPNKDYVVNSNNPYEIYLPKGIKYGDVISIYYLVIEGEAFKSNAIISDEFDFGDISNMSFLEFIDYLQRKLINARNRQTITDHDGGWYPSLLRIYHMYLKRSNLSDQDPLKSNGYTFENLYPFLSKYNSFFQRFVDQLLPATIILRKGGLLVRNTVFTKQKFGYKLGVNLINKRGSAYPNSDLYKNGYVNYLGDDGAMFQIKQNIDVPLILSGLTKVGVATTTGIMNTGAYNINGYETLKQYYMQYRTPNGRWNSVGIKRIYNPLTTDNYLVDITGLTQNTDYEYRAVFSNSFTSYSANTLTIKTLAEPITATGKTAVGHFTLTGITNTGGYGINEYNNVEYYGMEYRVMGSIANNSNDITISKVLFNDVEQSGGVRTINVCGIPSNLYSGKTTSNWLNTTSLNSLRSPTPTGVVETITISENTTQNSRSGIICYVPKSGTTKCVTINQCGLTPVKYVSITGVSGGYGTSGYNSDVYCRSNIIEIPEMSTNECYLVDFSWNMNKPATISTRKISVSLNKKDNTTNVFTNICLCSVSNKYLRNCSGSWNNITIDPNYTYFVDVCASTDDETGYSATASVSISTITNISGKGNFARNSNNYTITANAVGGQII